MKPLDDQLKLVEGRSDRVFILLPCSNNIIVDVKVEVGEALRISIVLIVSKFLGAGQFKLLQKLLMLLPSPVRL